MSLNPDKQQTSLLRWSNINKMTDAPTLPKLTHEAKSRYARLEGDLPGKQMFWRRDVEAGGGMQQVSPGDGALAKKHRVVVSGRRLISFVARGLLSSVIAGCASSAGIVSLSEESSPATKAMIVGRQAEARWRSLIAEDVEGAYRFLSPGSRSLMTFEEYKKRHRVGFYRDVKLQSVNCEIAACTVKLLLTYDAKGVSGIQTPLTERWVIENGRVWFVEQR